MTQQYGVVSEENSATSESGTSSVCQLVGGGASPAAIGLCPGLFEILVVTAHTGASCPRPARLCVPEPSACVSYRCGGSDATSGWSMWILPTLRRAAR